MLYWFHELALLAFADLFNKLVFSKIIHVLPGDFTVDAVDVNVCWILHNVLDGYVMVVSEPTHLEGCLLDHVFINKYILPDIETDTYDKHIYFSDHNAVLICLKCITKEKELLIFKYLDCKQQYTRKLL